MKINIKKFLLITIITFLVGSIFSFLTMHNVDVYKELNKPFEIPSIVFPIVWSILYLLMSVSCYIISESKSKQKDSAILIYGVQLVINSIWTLIFFGFNQYLLSFIWILLLLISIIFMIIKFYKINKSAGLLQIPYLLWTLFASYLNLMIYILNK